LAGRAAQVDADIRSQEWLSRLLVLVEGQKMASTRRKCVRWASS
jgi:hypothetical protein